MPEGTRLLTRRIGGGGPGGSRSWRRRGSPSDTPLCPPSRSWPAAPPTPPPQPRGPPPRRPAPGSYRIPRILPPPGRRRVGGVRRGREQEKRRGAARLGLATVVRLVASTGSGTSTTRRLPRHNGACLMCCLI
jgi:hypothetical protein